MLNEERFFFGPEVTELQQTFQSMVVTIFTTCSNVNKFCPPRAPTPSPPRPHPRPFPIPGHTQREFVFPASVRSAINSYTQKKSIN